MHRMQQMQTGKKTKPTGFTLIELLVVISIIAILAGLLLTGVQSARRAVNHAQATQDIRNLETALATFHAEFGSYPPSSITLYENASEWDASSRQKIDSLWGNFNYKTDIDGDGTPGEVGVSVTFNGAECLVFFLGGMIPSDGVPRGFASNPANPLKVDNGKRLGPFMEFDLKRLIPTNNGKFVYLDSYQDQTVPIWYLSSYDGRGYAVPDPVNVALPHELPSGMKDCYRQVFSMDHDGTVWSVTTDGRSKPAWKDKGFQLISPGRDAIYGIGGYYADGLPQPSRPNWIPSANWNSKWSLFQTDRKNHPEITEVGGDEDNITNFAQRLN